jgi:hypothetical protein
MTKRPIRLSFLDTLLQDLRYAFRTLRRDKGFAAFAILIAGLGIGASCTVFSVLNALLLHPPPFREPERLVWLANHDVSGLSGQTTQVGAFLDLREHSQSFSDLAAYSLSMAWATISSAAPANPNVSPASRFPPTSSSCSASSRKSAVFSTPMNASGTAPRPSC